SRRQAQGRSAACRQAQRRPARHAQDPATLRTLSEVNMEKLLVMQVAAQLANAIMAHVGDKLPVDADIKDPTTRAMNLEAWELFRIFYHGALKALADDQDWPAPQISATGLLSGVTSPDNLTSLLSTLAGVVAGPQAKGIADAIRSLITPAKPTV